MRYTPENIESLADNEVFVFGSNLNGIHAGGTAKLALDKFGAIWGQGVGLQGKSYAIPTKDHKMNSLELRHIRFYVNQLLYVSFLYPKKTFLVTKIGCGLAGYTIKDIAPMFRSYPLNVVVPQEFAEFNA
jgi:hypothetical protein